MDISTTPSPPHADTQLATASAVTSTRQAPTPEVPPAEPHQYPEALHQAPTYRTDSHSAQAHQLIPSQPRHELPERLEGRLGQHNRLSVTIGRDNGYSEFIAVPVVGGTVAIDAEKQRAALGE